MPSEACGGLVCKSIDRSRDVLDQATHVLNMPTMRVQLHPL